MINKAIQQFRLNIKSVRELHSIVDSVGSMAPSLDLDEILRAEIVLAISALDCFLHDLVRLGTLEVYSGIRQYSHSASEKPAFQEPKLIHLLTLDKHSQIQELDTEFRRIFSTKTFQDPELIHKNLLRINVNNVWADVASHLGMAKTDVEQKLGLIVSRRNSIVHEADIDHSGVIGQKNAIDKNDVKNDIDFIDNICEKIFLLAEAAR